MVGKHCPYGGWHSFKTLQRHGGPTGGRHVLPIFTLPSTLLAVAPCGSLWDLGSSSSLVLFPFLVFPFVACSLVNCVILQIVILHLTCGLCFLLQQWIVRYGVITLSNNLCLREFPQVRAYHAGLTSDEVSLWVPIFMLFHAFPLG